MSARILVLSTVAACGGHHLPLEPDAAAIDAAADAVMIPDANLEPPTLFGTGLCVDMACSQISPGVHAYAPRFALWSDGATKRRWIYLPMGARIDTTDMDHWIFPIGTKIWKEFTRDGVRVETRYLAKVGAGNTVDDWYYMPYQWNATEDDTVAVPDGVQNADGTDHDIPSQSQCRVCHERLAPTRVLGFGAIQLDYDAPSGQLDLQDLIDAGLLASPPSGTSPYFPLPGNPYPEQAALGYLHANCGHCHNPLSDLSATFHLALRLDVATLGALATTPAYATTVGVDATLPIDGLTKLVVPMNAASSILIDRFESTNLAVHMPALGTELTDPTGDTTLRDWITAMVP